MKSTGRTLHPFENIIQYLIHLKLRDFLEFSDYPPFCDVQEEVVTLAINSLNIYYY